MKYCKYHPLAPATYNCLQCHTPTCDDCIDDGVRGDKHKCIMCERDLDSLGASFTTEPFWRRLQESFRYPLNGNALTLIVGVSIISAILGAISFLFIVSIILYLLVMGAMMKYCFSCLEHTAMGSMVPPDITVAYSGGMRVLVHLVIMIVAVSAAVITVAHYLGPEIAGLLGFIILLGVPAILINYALSESLASALNLLSMLRLMLIIGLPYGLLIGFIMIMAGSVGVINELIGDRFAMLSSILQSVVGYYYMVVVFHIMGYMIFQYQGSLGFTARKDSGEEGNVRSQKDRLNALINVNLKEGNLKQANQYFADGLLKFGEDQAFLDRYFEFLSRTKNVDGMSRFAEQYMLSIVKAGRSDKLALTYKQILQLVESYRPESPELRYAVARDSRRVVDPATVIKLIKGLHKEHPEFPHLINAYELMAESFDDLPNMSEHARKCRALIAHLRDRLPKQDGSEKIQVKKAVFGAVDLSETKKELELPLENVKSESISTENEHDAEESGEPKDLPPIEFK